ncbi:hypothetical protein [Oceanibium sediminis]|uniref:hypothetical protein n=1 Tax=Oceanibium sediminis TaxID=2026339 RepID=UPI000DD49530|nr:hypothetical protein [Oceanibium sediminis]
MAVRGAILWAARLLRLSAILTLVVALAMLARTPLGQVYAERSLPEFQRALDRVIGTEFDGPWARDTLARALDAEPVDWVLIDSTMEIVRARALPLDPALDARLSAARARDRGVLGQSKNCAACAAGLPGCRMSDGLVCALAVEVTPIGDVRALSAETRAWMNGDPVDKVNVALAGVGLGATLAILVTAGSSASVKGGVAVIRVARRADGLTPALQAQLARIGGELVDFDKLPRGLRAGLDPNAYRAALNPRALGEGAALLDYLGRMQKAVPNSHALALLPLIDNGADARRIANLSEAGGLRTVAVTNRLGKSRALRLTARFSRAGRTLVGLAIALALQALAILASLAQGASGRIVRRAAR